MGVYATTVNSLKRDLIEKGRLESRLEKRREEIKTQEQEYEDLVAASKLISAVADKLFGYP